MKNKNTFIHRLLAVSLFLFISLTLRAQDEPPAKIKYKDQEFTIHVGDTLQLGMGSNPDGSFMYVISGADTPLDKEHAMKKVVVRKMKYFKKMNVYRINLFAPYVSWIYIDIIEGNISQAVEKGELILKAK